MRPWLAAVTFALASCNCGSKPCTADAECLNGMHCETGASCVPDCQSDRECLNGTHCAASGRCAENVGDGGPGDSGLPDAGPDDAGAGDAGPGDAGLPDAGNECRAQRTVHIVGGNGGLAWFTLLWPPPIVITNFSPSYSYDDPARAAEGVGLSHLLFSRRLDGGSPLRLGNDGGAEPGIFIAGRNVAHAPSVDLSIAGHDVIAIGAAAQSSLAAPVPVLSFACATCYTNDAGEPAPVLVGADNIVDQAIAALRTQTPISVATEAELRPSAAQLQQWAGVGASFLAVDLASRLWVAANAFRLGLVSTVIVPGYNNDPHGAFANGTALVVLTADEHARILDAFYAELARHPEPACTHLGAPLTLDKNVVLVISGDTFKQPFDHNAWFDSTPGGSNLVIVRSNGFLNAGWHGSLVNASTRYNFDPVTGAVSTTADAGHATTATLLGIVYAITRGDAARVSALSSAPYDGVVRP